MKFSVYFFLFFFTSLSVFGQDWKVSKIEESRINFENGQSIDTKLSDLKVIDLIHPNNYPFLILSGRGCDYCDANVSIYIHSPLSGDMKNESTQVRYSFPGEVYDPFINDSLFYSDLYYGKCISEKKVNIIWIQKEFDSDTTKRSVFYIGFLKDDISHNTEEKEISSFEKKIQESLSSECYQIKGISQSAEM